MASSSPAPASLPVVALTGEVEDLPEPPRFLGPGSRTIEAGRRTVPLLLSSWLLALSLQGVLSLPLVLVVGGLGLVVGGVGQIWLQRRRRALLRCAISLTRYAERALGPGHEITERARSAAEMIRGASLDCWTEGAAGVEEGLRYTWELVRQRKLLPAPAST